MKAIINKEARFNYEILDKFEVGLVLHGHEVKSIKSGQIKLKGSYVSVQNDKQPTLYLKNAHVNKYVKTGSLPDYDPIRPRKLLMKQKEINSIMGKIKTSGLTLVPIKVYTKCNLIKLEIGLAKGKKKSDKRETIKNRDLDREMRRELKY